MNPNFLKPKYDAGGFASLPQRILTAFDTRQYDAVVLLFVDAFGWRFYERFQDAPFLKRLGKHGTVEKLTSQFPSTTAAHVTTMHTGLPVGESGVHEWYYYEPHVDHIIAPLLFSHAGIKERDTLKKTQVKPEDLYPKSVFYPELKHKGVDAHIFGLREYTPSTFGKVTMKGADFRGFKTLSEALVNLGLLLEKPGKPVYANLYFDKIDSIAHEYGPTAPQTEAEIETLLMIMERHFTRVFTGKKRVLFLMTADHGMCEVSPQRTVYINTDSRFTGCERFIKRNRRGRLLIPAGSARDMFLYVKDDMLDEAQAFFAERLTGVADVVKTESLMQQGYFGEKISKRFRERAGNLLILPYRYEAVWWFEKEKFEQKFFGHHGGLTPQEMEIPLCAYEIG